MRGTSPNTDLSATLTLTRVAGGIYDSQNFEQKILKFIYSSNNIFKAYLILYFLVKNSDFGDF